MAVNYKILWFEDNPDVYEDHYFEIDEYLSNLGFSLNVVREEDSQNLDEVLKKDYDLILSDMNLGEGETGKQIIEQIRIRQIYTEVLFYSANETGINKILNEDKWVERVSFCVGIENLKEKINQVISLTVKKLQEVNSIRGMVMAQTSELDIKMKDIILAFMDKFDNATSLTKKEELKQKVIDNREGQVERLKGIDVKDNFQELSELLTAADKIGAINRLIKFSHNHFSTRIFAENKEIFNLFDSEISRPRNVLAHCREVEKDSGEMEIVSDLTGDVVSFNNGECSGIRKNIKKHKENLEKISEKIITL